MRFKIFIILGVVFSMFVFAPAMAQDKYGLDTTVKATGGLLPTSIKGAETLPQLAGNIVKVVLSLIGILFFALMLYAGITWMKAFGRSEDVEKAKEMITQAIIGLIIVMAAYAITNFVFTNLGATGGGGSSGGNETPSTLKEGDACTIVGNKWAVSPFVTDGAKGIYNTKAPAECQPACRFHKSGAVCQTAPCGNGKTVAPNATDGIGCPSSGNCCLP
ncbi:MAG: pilin [Candidatus Magasanikbacteria bacterium]